MAPYPRWRYFPSYAAPSAWVDPIVAVFASNRAQIDSAAEHAKRMESNDIPGVIASDLQAHGFDVEQGKQKAGKLPARSSSETKAPTSAHTRSTPSSRVQE